MLTKAELVCGVSGFLIVLGMLIIGTYSIPLPGLIMLWTGVIGIIISTILHESD